MDKSAPNTSTNKRIPKNKLLLMVVVFVLFTVGAFFLFVTVFEKVKSSNLTTDENQNPPSPAIEYKDAKFVEPPRATESTASASEESELEQ